MLEVIPSGDVMGATIANLDLAQPMDQDTWRALLRALGRYSILRFPEQRFDSAGLKRFSARFGSLEINVAGKGLKPDMPEVMVLSNMVENGRPTGLPDAGQDWHTDLSYSHTIAFANILYALKVPRADDGQPLGGTEFASMHAAYDGLPAEYKERLAEATVTHDYEKLWEKMRRLHGSKRPPLSAEQRRRKPPVSHPLFLTHPITGRKVLYANPGYAASIDGMDRAESEETLNFLFEHQLKPEYRFTHRWNEGDAVIWDNIGTVHRAIGDYGADQHRLIERCQTMADRIFEDAAALTG